MKNHHCGLLALLALTVFALTLTYAQPKVQVENSRWPLVRGNALQTGVATTTLPDKLQTLWTFKAEDAFEGGAAIVDGTVYAASYDEHLYAIDLKTGKQKWKYKMGPTKAAPAVLDGAVYVGDEDGYLHCVDAKTGQKRWKFETQGEISSTPNFYKGQIIISSWDSTLYSLDTKGKELWKLKTDGPVNGSPTIVGDYTFFAGCDSTLHTIDLKQRKELRTRDLGSQVGGTPAVHGDYLYVGTMEAPTFLSIDWKKNQIAWVFEPKRRGQGFYSSAAVTDKLLVVGNRNRKIYGLERKTGKKVWEFATDRRVDPSPVIVGSRVYAPSQDGNLYVLDLKTGNKLAEHRLGRTILASPAVAEHRLVLGTIEGVLYCLGKK